MDLSDTKVPTDEVDPNSRVRSPSGPPRRKGETRDQDPPPKVLVRRETYLPQTHYYPNFSLLPPLYSESSDSSPIIIYSDTKYINKIILFPSKTQLLRV